MPKRDRFPVGAPCWIDLTTTDTARSREFYCEVFGWTAEEPAEEFGGYFNFRKDDVRIAGCMASQPSLAVPNVWSIYLTTGDAQKTIDAAAEGGAQVVVPAMQVGELGTMAYLVDTGGAAIGLWQPAEHPGFGIVMEPGAPSWFELHTRDYSRSVEFYRDVFRWDTSIVSDTPEFRYTTLRSGEDPLAGIADSTSELAEGSPAKWFVYFGTSNTDDTLEQIVESGGSVLEPAADTPYGRLATAADPNGAQFKLVAANEARPAGS